MQRTVRVGVALIATALAGCASSPVTMQESYTPPASAKRKPLAKGSRTGSGVSSLARSNCRIHFAGLTDSRTDPTILGSVAGRPVRSPGEGSHWIGEMLRTGLAHQQIDVTLAPESAAPEAAVVAEANLVTAWVSSLTTSMGSNIVLAVSFQRAGAPPESKIYRGSSTVTNWVSGQGEIQSLVNNAFGDLLIKLGPDIESRCASGRS